MVEDDENDSILLMRELKRAHLDDAVTVIRDGHAALKQLLETSQPPLVLFLDLSLPGMGGLELLRKIRGVARLKELPVIVMTGSINPKHREECARLGVTAFLAKPIGLAAFIKTVTHLFPERAPAGSAIS